MLASRLLAASALLLFIAISCGGSKEEAPSGTFSTLSYNVAGLPQEISTVNPEDHIPLISPLLNNYDVVLTQEDFDWWLPDLDRLDFANYHERLRSQVDHPYQSARHPGPEAVGIDIESDRPVMQVGDGLGLLSRFPFDEFRRVPWATCYGVGDSGSDCLAMKGFGMARIELADGVVVDFYNLHADADVAPGDESTREAGFIQLAAYIAQNSVDHAIILGGDTNLHTNPQSDDPNDVNEARVWDEFLEATGLTDVCIALDCENPTRIDKFAFRDGAGIDLEPLTWVIDEDKLQDATGTPLSDHDALEVGWRWTQLLE